MMPDTIRLFAAASLTPSLTDALQALLPSFRHPAIRVLPAQNLHLTLYFMGNVPRARMPFLQEQIRHVAAQQHPFILELDCLEPGPGPKARRLVWARFKPHSGFEKLSQQLTQALSAVPVKPQNPLPHVTLARFRTDMPKPENLPSVYPQQPLQLPVTSVALWQSVLASPHPVYTVLENYPLGKNLQAL